MSVKQYNAAVTVARIIIGILVGVIIAQNVGVPLSTYWWSTLWTLVWSVPVVVVVALLVGARTGKESNAAYSSARWAVVVALLVDRHFGFTLDQIIAFALWEAITVLAMGMLLPTKEAQRGSAIFGSTGAAFHPHIPQSKPRGRTHYDFPSGSAKLMQQEAVAEAVAEAIRRGRAKADANSAAARAATGNREVVNTPHGDVIMPDPAAATSPTGGYAYKSAIEPEWPDLDHFEPLDQPKNQGVDNGCIPW